MYFLEFGQKERLRCYIFEMDGDFFAKQFSTPNDPINWKRITGTKNAVTIHYDPIKGSDVLLPSVVKTSAQLSLFRTDINDFNDIISSADNRWKCVITKGRVTRYRDDNDPWQWPPGRYTPFLEGAGNVIFIGTLTQQAHSEGYVPVPDVNLVFHDRLGELNEIVYQSSNDILPFTQILADLLQGTTIGSGLEIQLPYRLENETQIEPHELLIDTRELRGKKRGEVLNTILSDLGLQLFGDYAKSSSGLNYFKLTQYGSAFVRYIGDVSHPVTDVYRYDINRSDLGAQVTTRTPFVDNKDVRIITFDTPMIRGGVTELLKRAKRVIAKNTLVPRGLVQPFLEEDTLTAPLPEDSSVYIDLDENTIITREWGYGSPLDYLINDVDGLAKVIRIGEQDKLAVTGRTWDGRTATVSSTRFVSLVGTYWYTLFAEFFNTVTSPGADFKVTLLLYAYTPGGDIYYWNQDWYLYDPNTHTPPNINITQEGYTSFELNISPPPYANGILFYMAVGFRVSSVNAPIVLTDCKMDLGEPADGLPPFIQVVTNLNSENRSDIEIENKLLTLPNIGGSMYWSGGLFYRDNTGLVSVLHNLMYEGNIATLLVHNSELIGNQAKADRMRLKGKVFTYYEVPPLVITICEWTDFMCEKVGGNNTGRGRATTLTITQTGTTNTKDVYNLFDAFGSYSGISENTLVNLSNNDYTDRADAFMDYLSVTDKMNNTAIKEVMFSCMVTENKIRIKVLLIWEGGLGAVLDTDGLDGHFTLVGSGETAEIFTTPFQRPKNFTHTFKVDPDTYHLDFSMLEGYQGGLGVPLYIYWSFDGENLTGGETTDPISSNQTVIVKVSPR